jgi:hypothetical protein
LLQTGFFENFSKKVSNERYIEIKPNRILITARLIISLLIAIFLTWDMASNMFDLFTFLNSKVLSAALKAILFLLAVVYGLSQYRKLLNRKSSLIISDQGIFDNVNFISVGLVPWSDIRKVEIKKVLGSQTFINVYVKDDKKYIDRNESFAYKKAMQYNQRIYGTPIGIQLSGFTHNRTEIKKLIESYLLEQ